MKQKLMLFAAFLFMSIGLASAQISTVTGEVVSSHDGQPVPGASVTVKGTQVSSFTATDGTFVIHKVPAEAKALVISCIGMKSTEVAIAEHVSVRLEPIASGEGPAVVIGYGTAKKVGTVVGSVTKVVTDQVKITPATTAMDALQGKAANVQILSNTGDAGALGTISTTIRGAGSLTASNEPLFVVDGSPVASSVFYMMNPNDIESYTVLRDASATSIYGSRAANGVIYVTTKKGSRYEKATVTIGQSFGWSQLARKVGNPMNSSQLLDYQLKNGIITGEQYNNYKVQNTNTDWGKYFFDNAAPMSQTTVSISGGSERTTYYTSFSYLDKNGLTPRSLYKRYTLRQNLDSRPLNWLHYGVNLGLSYDERNVDPTNTGDVYLNSGVLGGVMAPPTVNPYNPDGSRIDVIPFLNVGYNNYVRSIYNPGKSNDARINGTAFLELTPLNGLTIRSQLGLDAADTRRNSYLLPSAPWNTKEGQGWAYKSFERFSMWTITNTIEYKFKIGEKHNFTLLAGHEGIKNTSDGFSADVEGLRDDRLLEFGSAAEANLSEMSSYTAKYEYLSFFGRIDYGFSNKYFANFTIRNDRCSRFGKNNRSATFLSGGLMWNMKAENFLKNVDWLDDLKLKASVGSTGNSGIGNYASLGTVGTIRYNGNPNAWVLSAPGNADLGWEKQIQWNFGVTARLWNRINLEANYYIRQTKDMLMEVPVPWITGFSENNLNIGEMKNSGIEFTFDADVVRSKGYGFNLNLYGNISYNKNEITKLFYGLNEWIIPQSGVAYVVGKSVNYYMPVRAGIDPADGQIMWYVPDENGKLTGETTKVFNEDALNVNTGKPRFAPWTGGFGLRAAWQGFTLNADFAFVLGKWMQDNIQYFTRNSPLAASGYNQDADMLNEWTRPGDITAVPRFGVSNQFDSSLLQNASFCRLKNISLSYDLPKAWMEATHFLTNVRFIGSIRNAFTITKWKGSDPEYDTNVAKAAAPNTREYTIGIEVTF